MFSFANTELLTMLDDRTATPQTNVLSLNPTSIESLSRYCALRDDLGLHDRPDLLLYLYEAKRGLDKAQLCMKLAKLCQCEPDVIAAYIGAVAVSLDDSNLCKHFLLGGTGKLEPEHFVRVAILVSPYTHISQNSITLLLCSAVLQEKTLSCSIVIHTRMMRTKARREPQMRVKL